MIEETSKPNTNPFLIFKRLNKTPLKNNSSDIGAIIIAENISKMKSNGLFVPLTTSNKGREIVLTMFKRESKGNNMF